MKQTMRRRAGHTFDTLEGSGRGMQFPLAISRNTHMFTILRTIYSLEPMTSESGLELSSCGLSMEFNDKRSPNWQLKDERSMLEDSIFSSDELDEHQRFERRDLYLNWFFFHPDSTSLVFVSQDLQTQSMAAVYGLRNPPEETLLNNGRLLLEVFFVTHRGVEILIK